MNTGFEGIIAPMTTPFDGEGEIVYEALEENVERYMSTSLSGLLVGGTTGEAAHLSFTEKIEIVRRVRELVSEEKKFLVGVSSPSLHQAFQFVRELRELEIDALLVSVPSYYKSKMTEEALGAYFEGLAGESPWPLLLYNIPKFSGVELTPSLVSRLADHAQIGGMKESSGNMIYLQKILQATAGQEFQVISGSAETFVFAHSLGVRAAILGLSCAIPEFVLDVYEACESRGCDIASKQRVLFQVSSTIVGKLSVPGVKYAMDLEGLKGMSSRTPLRALDQQEELEVETVLKLGLEKSLKRDYEE